MRPVTRDELLDYQTWTDRRPELRPGVLEAKRVRRALLPPYLTLLFENRDTVRYQVQEMMRVEHIVRERDILHELATYNELLGGPGELGATLLIGIDDEVGRAERLHRWLDLPGRLYLELPDGAKVRATWDERQIGRDRLSTVQYLKFDVGGVAPVAFGTDHDDPEVRGRVALTDEQIAALAADLADR